MARGDLPFNRLELNLQPIVAALVYGPKSAFVERSRARRSDMQIRDTPASLPGAVESPPLEDVVMLPGRAGVSLGLQRAFSATVRSVHDASGGVIASRCVEIPLVGRDGEISGILCRTAPSSDTRGVLSSRGPDGARAIEDVAQFVVHDINNLLAVIDSGLRLLECQRDAAYREIVVADHGEGMTDEVLSQAFTPYFTTEAAGSGAVFGLAQVWRFAQGQGGALGVESERDVGTLVCLFIPRVGDAAVQSSIVGTEIAYTPSPTAEYSTSSTRRRAAPTS
jgi:hypothetical protein